ncbi:DUF4168 domain-containing protein [Spirulina subsalsa]|uniref:DUF4168 domain-containing protein n=1 Tax=Spirulina subsalsa TaxID=54311 RepID=UPI001ED9988F|nr:DUF4168 domain-containing protein [Spirulina subsalsa]
MAVAASEQTTVNHYIAQASGAAISERELAQFVSAWQKLGEIELAFRESAVEIVEEQGFTPERFNAILEAFRNQAEPTPALTNQEKEKLDTIVAQIEPLRQRTQVQMENALQSEGLAPDRFSEIYNTIQQDETLQQRVQQMMESQIGQ